MWNEKEIMQQVDNYFDNVTEEQFLKDLEETGCLHLVEDVSFDDISNGKTIEFTYANWRGETSKRTATVTGLIYDSNEWHKEKQWLLVAIDQDKQQIRYFALKDMSDVKVIKSEKGTHKHWWYTVDSGMGIRCDKCDAYTNMMTDENFRETEYREDCPMSDEEFEKQNNNEEV